MQFQFSIPSSIAFAPGCAETVGHLVRGLEVKKVLFVYDSALAQTGIISKISTALTAAKLEVTPWDGVIANPTDVIVEEGARQAREAEIEAIVVIGGGSAIDTAKAIALLMTNESPINLYDGMNMVEKPGVPVVAIPTTAGTASEVTSFTIITDTEKKKKMVIGGKNVGARVALIDPLLTVSMPPSLTAATGMDALTHAVEAYLSRGASLPTDINALKAIELISHNLPAAVANGADIEARTAMMLGSMLAGFAFNSAVLGLAHSLAHPLNVHCGVPHGVANAAVLPHVMAFNGGEEPERIRDIGTAMGLAVTNLSAEAAVERTVSAVAELAGSIGIPSLQEAGVSRDDFDLIATDALEEVSTIFNPRDPSKEDILAILDAAYS